VFPFGDGCFVYKHFLILIQRFPHVYNCRPRVVVVPPINLLFFLLLSLPPPLLVKKEKPKFLTKPQDQTVVEGEDVTFEAEATGKPEPTIEWLFGRTTLIASERVIITQDGTKCTLTIKAAEVKEAGQYTIKASNDQGSLSANAKLVVTSKCAP
jgi:hypothetical protein